MRCRMCRMTYFWGLKSGVWQSFITFSRYCQPEYQTTIILPTGILNGVSTKISPSQVPNSGRKIPDCGKKVPRLGISAGQCCCSCFFLKCCCSWFNCCFCWRSRRFAMLHFAWFLSMKRAKMGLSEHHPTHPTSHPTPRKPLIISTLSVSVGNVGN